MFSCFCEKISIWHIKTHIFTSTHIDVYSLITWSSPKNTVEDFAYLYPVYWPLYFAGIKHHHKKDPNISPSKINVKDKLDISGEGTDLTKPKAHGNHFTFAGKSCHRKCISKVTANVICVKLASVMIL